MKQNQTAKDAKNKAEIQGIADAFIKVEQSYTNAWNAYLSKNPQHQRVHSQNLAHALRQVAELGMNISKRYPTTLRVFVLPKAKQISQTKNGNPITLCLFEAGISFDTDKVSFSGTLYGDAAFSIEASVKKNPLGYSFGAYFHAKGAGFQGNLHALNTKNLNFFAWLNHAPIRVQYELNGVAKEQMLTRENIIKRVSNIKGGSHPASLADQFSNVFDEAIKEIEKHSIFEFSIDYFLLLGFAEAAIAFGKKNKII